MILLIDLEMESVQNQHTLNLDCCNNLSLGTNLYLSEGANIIRCSLNCGRAEGLRLTSSLCLGAAGKPYF